MIKSSTLLLQHRQLAVTFGVMGAPSCSHGGLYSPYYLFSIGMLFHLVYPFFYVIIKIFKSAINRQHFHLQTRNMWPHHAALLWSEFAALLRISHGVPSQSHNPQEKYGQRLVKQSVLLAFLKCALITSLYQVYAALVGQEKLAGTNLQAMNNRQFIQQLTTVAWIQISSNVFIHKMLHSNLL